MEIQIHHIGNQNGSSMFEVIRSRDMKCTAAVDKIYKNQGKTV